MKSIRFSVIIPAYNNAEFLGETIQSVLAQTYTDLELIVVNDASPDNVSEVVNQFSDPRIKYVVHEYNQGLSAARNTGIKASTGDYIAFLDGDDLFHPNKLQMHAEFLDKHPEIGVTYNARFELNHSQKTIREIWRPPLTVTLADLVLGFPFGPSDMVVQRDWMFRVGLFDVYHVYVGEDLDINCRLGLEGCKFASVDRALNCRRYHSGRILRNLKGAVEDTIRPLTKTFAAPDCPPEVSSLREIAPSIHYMLWSLIAYDQQETQLGQEYCREALRLNPTILNGKPCQFTEAAVGYSIADESREHAMVLGKIFGQLPAEYAAVADQLDWAIAQGCLRRGLRAIMWGRLEDGQEHFRRAALVQAQIDQRLMQQYTAQLLSFEVEFGSEAAQDVFRKTIPNIEKLSDKRLSRWLKGNISASRAFKNYHQGNYSRVPNDVIRALSNDPNYLKDRGIQSIFVRSLFSKSNSSRN